MIELRDAVVASNLPLDSEAVAGYRNGRFANIAEVIRRFPHLAADHRVFAYTVTASELGDFLDIENGDATPEQAVPWFKEAEHAGIFRPGLYGSRNTMKFVVPLLTRAGIERPKCRLILATDSGVREITPGFDGDQYKFDVPPGFDANVVLDTFFPHRVTKPTKPVRHIHKAEVTYDADKGSWAVVSS